MKYFSVISLILLFSSHTFAAGDIAAGKEKSATCAACHGVDGNSSNAIWPSLAGQHAEYIEKQLYDFRSEKRVDAQMSPQATNLSDEDIADLAAFFQAEKPNNMLAKAKAIKLGERLYRAGDAKRGLAACMACHGPNGLGNPAALYPKINQQHAAYNAAQLKQFKAEERDNDRASVMRDIASRMTNADIEAVSNYIQGLQ